MRVAARRPSHSRTTAADRASADAEQHHVPRRHAFPTGDQKRVPPRTEVPAPCQLVREVDTEGTTQLGGTGTEHRALEHGQDE
jgi:hypothetical protein